MSLRLSGEPFPPATIAAWLLGIFFFVPALSAEELDLRLRIAWGGAERTTWSGSISVDAGEFADLVPLGIEKDEPGCVWLEPSAVHVDARTRRDYGGVDVSLVAPPEARLTIRLQSGASGQEVVTETGVGKLVANEHRIPLDSAGNYLVVSRAPGDRLRVNVSRSHMVYAPGSTVALELTASPELVAGQDSFELIAEVARPRGGDVLHTQSSRVTREELSGGSMTVALRAPREEGVYEARLLLQRPPGIAQRIVPTAGSNAVAQRLVQFVVFDRSSRHLTPAIQWEEIAAIDLANPNWSARVPSWFPLERLPGLPDRPLSNVPHTTGNVAGKTAFMLPGPERQRDRPWYAIPVSVPTPNVPHLITIEVPASRVSQIGLTILEPNAAGFVYPVSRDFGTFSVGTGIDASNRWLRKQFLFWPKSTSPMLLFTNEHPSEPAYIGEVRLFQGNIGQGTILEMLPSANHRTAAMLVDRPLLVESLGAREVLDAANHQSVEDWQTFYDAATRLVQFVQLAGYNAAVLTAFADGSTIYPSEVLQSTPRYDTGVLATRAQDPLRKDLLELVLSGFDRAGLSLFVGLEFSTPLPELERLRRGANAQESGIEWVGVHGQLWGSQTPSAGGAGPHYNLLNERVQQAVLEVAREVIARYEAHPSLAGLALQLSGSGYAQLLEPHWGFDDDTIRRFERDTGIQVPGNGPHRFAARANFLLREKRSEWIEWRAQVVSDFYARLSEEVRSGAEHRELLIVPARLLEGPEIRARLRPTLPNLININQVLLELGIDAESLAQREGIVLLRPTFAAPPAPIAAFAAEHQVNGAGELERALSKSRVVGELSYFPSLTRNRRLLSFDQQGPFGPNKSFTAPLTQLRPSGYHRGRALARSLAEHDAAIYVEGGQTIVTEWDEDLRRGLEVFRKLPAGNCKKTVTQRQPITVRTYHTESDSFVCVMNESPWVQNVTVVLEAPPGSQVLEIGTDQAPHTMPVEPARTPWELEAVGYGVYAARISAASARVIDVQLAPSRTMEAELKMRKAQLEAQTLRLSAAPSLGVLENPGFEADPGSGGIPGWQVVNSQNGQVELDVERTQEGKQALKVTSRGPGVSVASNAFSARALGRLALYAYVRRSAESTGVRVLMVIEDAQGGTLYRQAGPLGANTGQASPPLHTEWRSYRLRAEDIPLDAALPLRVRFEVAGSGTVWIDDVMVCDGSLIDQQGELAKIGFAAGVALDKEAWSDCLACLDGFWPRYLAAHVPLPPEAGPSERASADTAEPAERAEAQPPGVADRIKRFVPQIFQR